ncbi:S-layer homology domain-containing protein [Metasolibacillus sp. FSL H7-0170]|uniref:S-layer homology domain-containing protein n=1 Tax=Metasolibacillus sp. FSL H7-0170 TaxID=2921431 RepID=UPI000793C214|nr:hypothetical protein A0U40_02925 [[Bacillus] sp. KCTC 13219]
MKSKMFLAIMIAAAISIAAPASAANAFLDVSEKHTHYISIKALAKAKIIGGYPDGTFKPAHYITRGQAANIITKVLAIDTKNVKEPFFSDLPKTHQYYGAIAALAERKAIKLEDFLFYTVKPNETITRGEVAFMLAQALELEAQGTSPFTDDKYINITYDDFEDISLEQCIAAIYENNIAKGISSKEFGVEQNVTRGQFSTMIYNVMILLDKEK